MKTTPFTSEQLIRALAWALRQDSTELLGVTPHGPEYRAFLGDRVNARPQPTVEGALEQVFTDLIEQYERALRRPVSVAAPGRDLT
jgi:hypothetical protein